MSGGQLLILILAFVVGTGGSFWLVNRIMNARLEGRLDAIRSEMVDEEHPLISRIEVWAREVLGKLVRYSMDEEKWESSPMRIRFLNAGYRGDLIILVYFGGKTFLAMMLPALYLILVGLVGSERTAMSIAFIAVGLAALGYYLPNALLNWKIRQRQRELFESFPDALDLIRVCVNAGLGLDAAIARVGQELRLKSQVLAEEFRLLSLELRAGATRAQALRNLALRTGVDDINALVAMLIQAERFGTNVSDSLKVHAEALRSKRQLRAQEAAGKIPVKLTIPMAICIMPALFIVIVGPAALSIIRMLSGH